MINEMLKKPLLNHFTGGAAAKRRKSPLLQPIGLDASKVHDVCLPTLVLRRRYQVPRENSRIIFRVGCQLFVRSLKKLGVPFVQPNLSAKCLYLPRQLVIISLGLVNRRSL